MSHEAQTAQDIADKAQQLGFDLVGFASPVPPVTLSGYHSWLDHGYHGKMAYLARPDTIAKRADLSLIQPGVQSVVTVGCQLSHRRPASRPT